MHINRAILKSEERIAFLLRSLYQSYGYRQYKMSKFEEYDFYAKNRDFLVSDNIISFTDTSGHLMALKPDVTLSIVKSTRDSRGVADKLYYNENVYRVPKGQHSYREIPQVGLECIGDLDEYNIFEAVLLAAKSLAAISEESVLTVSHLGIIDALLDDMDLHGERRKEALRLIAGKNMHELERLINQDMRNCLSPDDDLSAGAAAAPYEDFSANAAAAAVTSKAPGHTACGTSARRKERVSGYSESRTAEKAYASAASASSPGKKEMPVCGVPVPRRPVESFLRVLRQNGRLTDVIPVLEEERCDAAAVAELKGLLDLLGAAGEGERIVMDFSAVSDMSYYNGIVLKGYISGIPQSVLGGGQYDRLLKKLGRRSRAIGFAVYLDQLELYLENDSMTDIDAVIKYDSSTDKKALCRAVSALIDEGLSCTAQKEIPEKLRYKVLYTISEDGSLRGPGAVTGQWRSCASSAAEMSLRTAADQASSEGTVSCTYGISFRAPSSAEGNAAGQSSNPGSQDADAPYACDTHTKALSSAERDAPGQDTGAGTPDDGSGKEVQDA